MTINDYAGELCLDINHEVDIPAALASQLPNQAQAEHWLGSALAAALPKSSPYQKQAEISLSLVDASAMQQLNQQYRDKNKPTNVLSFPTDFPEELNVPLLGDIIICPSIVEAEASAQNKSLESHWAHLCVHGVLHLLGFDHIEEQEADSMEALETKILLDLGYQAPYS